MWFEVSGRPVPYIRTTQKQKFVDARYRRYRTYKEYVATCVRIAMQRNGYAPFEKGVPLEFGLRVYLKGGLDADLSNYVKGVEDALNKVAFADDRWIHRYQFAEKVFVDSIENERIEIEINAI